MTLELYQKLTDIKKRGKQGALVTLDCGADYSLEILVMVKFLKHTNQNYLIYTDFKNNVKFQTRLDLGCVPF